MRESKKPIKPKVAKAMMIVANGTESFIEDAVAVDANVAIGVIDGCGVKVGKRVLVGSTTN